MVAGHGRQLERRNVMTRERPQMPSANSAGRSTSRKRSDVPETPYDSGKMK
jgi:hypothetical protein